MDWIFILAFILLGLTLIAAEIIFIPGTTVVGFIGFATMAGGIYYGYDVYSAEIWKGHAILGGTVVIGGIMTYFCLKFEIWRKFALEEKMDGKAHANVKAHLKEGQEGIALSALRPMGMAEFNNEDFEVKTYASYVEANQKVKIIKIENNTIIVEPFN